MPFEVQLIIFFHPHFIYRALARMHASSAAGSDYFEAAAAVDAGIIRTAGRAQIKDLKDHSVSPEMEAFPRVLFALGVILFGGKQAVSMNVHDKY